MTGLREALEALCASAEGTQAAREADGCHGWPATVQVAEVRRVLAAEEVPGDRH